MKKRSFVPTALALFCATSLWVHANLNHSEINTNVNALSYCVTPMSNNRLFGITAHINTLRVERSLKTSKQYWLNSNKIKQSDKKQDLKNNEKKLFDWLHIGYSNISTDDFYSQNSYKTI